MKATISRVREMTLGELASRIPFAASLFHRHQLDFCCRGDQKLAEACHGKGIDDSEIVEELRQLMGSKGEIDWEDMSSARLTRHIIDQYHEGLRNTVPELLRLAKKLEASHRSHASCPAGLPDLLSRMWEELELHMQKEESILFPMLAGPRGPQEAGGPIRQMVHEHVEHGENLTRLRALCHDFRCPEDACSTWRALYLGLAALEEDLMHHIHLENNVLFQRAIAELGVGGGAQSRSSGKPEI